MYINCWIPFPYKPVFKSKFYPNFVSFGIRTSHYVEYKIERTSSSHEGGDLYAGLNVLILCMKIMLNY